MLGAYKINRKSFITHKLKFYSLLVENVYIVGRRVFYFHSLITRIYVMITSTVRNITFDHNHNQVQSYGYNKLWYKILHRNQIWISQQYEPV